MIPIDCISIKKETLKEQKYLIDKFELTPKTLIIVMNNDKASMKYVQNKMRSFEEVGIQYELMHLNESTTESELIGIISINNHIYDAIIIQKPLPSHINSDTIDNYIHVSSDCDGTSYYNMGLLAKEQSFIMPATPKGIAKMLNNEMELSGADVLIIGRSLLVGKPLSMIMTMLDTTVTLAHSSTKNIQEKISSGNYDIIISAVGKPKIFKNAKAKILVDVGINFEDGKMCGDFDIDTCECEKFTSVPNGVGQLTVASLVENIVQCAISKKERLEKEKCQ